MVVRCYHSPEVSVKKKSGNDAVYRNSAAPERSEPEPEFIVGPVVYAG